MPGLRFTTATSGSANTEANKIGKFDPSTGAFTEFTVPTPDGGPAGLVIDGNYVWFTEYNRGKSAGSTPQPAPSSSSPRPTSAASRGT